YKKKHVIPGGFVSGPNKPKNIESFLFSGMHHISSISIQKEGFAIWDSLSNHLFLSNPWVHTESAGGPAMVLINLSETQPLPKRL
ncbi:hypothetical protein SERLA73DRAFT_50890, partial [Serpula lacrymans var. lacrymans S7.3]